MPWVQRTWVGGSHTSLTKLRMLTICFALYLLLKQNTTTHYPPKNKNLRKKKKNSRKTKFHVLELDFGEKKATYLNCFVPSKSKVNRQS